VTSRPKDNNDIFLIIYLIYPAGKVMICSCNKLICTLHFHNVLNSGFNYNRYNHFFSIMSITIKFKQLLFSVSLAIGCTFFAPAAAYKDMYVDSITGKANTELSQSSHLASGVPGTPAGLFAALAYAKLPMKTLIQPAIDLAEKGFVISDAEARGLNGSKSKFK